MVADNVYGLLIEREGFALKRITQEKMSKEIKILSICTALTIMLSILINIFL